MKGTDAASPYCVALAGVPKVDAYCAIHGNHPSCCRAVEVGSDQCTRARRAHGLPDLDAPDIDPSPDLPRAA